MASQVPAGSSAQAAVRRSRAGGQPRSHAAPYPIAATSVTGHAATARAASSSQPAALIILRSSHRHMVSLIQDHTLIAVGSGVNAAAGSSRTTTRGWSPGGSDAAARVTTGRAAGAVRYTTCAYRMATKQPGHDPGGPGDRLGGELDLDRPHLPGVGAGRRCDGQWISASGTCSRRPAAGWSARSRRSECHQGWPWLQAGLPCSHSRAARTARMWARRPSAGRVAGNPSPVSVIPARVSQHHPGPGPSRPVSAYPARRHRATIAGSRSGCTRSAMASRSYGRSVMLPAQQEPVDVALAEPDRPGVSAARRAGRGDGVLCLYRHDDPCLPRSNSSLSCPVCP